MHALNHRPELSVRSRRVSDGELSSASLRKLGGTMEH
jgi:hypothetical protein